MKITRETYYAIRIVSYLSRQSSIVGAKQISEETDVPQRFSLKILGKLCNLKILKSFKGTSGGYSLNKDAKDISINDVIVAIQGEIAINTCLESGNDTSCPDDCACSLRNAFAIANKALIHELSLQTFDKL